MAAPVDTPRRDAEPDRSQLRLITHDGLEPLDRWAPAPVNAAEADRTATWMSVDPSVVVDIEERR